MKALVLLVVVLGTACGSDGNNDKNDAGVPVDAPLGGPDASCFTNPQTHKEIINACTNAQKIERNVTPPLLNSDGSLPGLP
jgi:hypothetical protein